MSVPYRRVGTSRDIPRRCAGWGERSEPGGESLLTVAKAPWASPSLLEKCADDARLVFVTGRGGAGFHFVTPPLLRPGVNSLLFLPTPYDTGPWPGCGAGWVFYFPR